MYDFLTSPDTIAAMVVGIAAAIAGVLTNERDKGSCIWVREIMGNGFIGGVWAIMVEGVWILGLRGGQFSDEDGIKVWVIMVLGALAAPSVVGWLRYFVKRKFKKKKKALEKGPDGEGGAG